jgi:hypothetical protein
MCLTSKEHKVICSLACAMQSTHFYSLRGNCLQGAADHRLSGPATRIHGFFSWV